MSSVQKPLFMYFVLFFRYPILTRSENLTFTIYTNFYFHDSVFFACLSSSMLGFHETKAMLNGNPGFWGKKEQGVNKVKHKNRARCASLGSFYLWGTVLGATQILDVCISHSPPPIGNYRKASGFLCETEYSYPLLLFFASPSIHFLSFPYKYFLNQTSRVCCLEVVGICDLSLLLWASYGCLLIHSALIWEETIKPLAAPT